ncbi:hypothetical protein C8Q69DRAFT_150036 [Paecilomyces variotii]|uniref:Serine/threonine-protein kinase ppk6 n=1 Tax=Byssochlamys spectabilis TaxID=264951 RepID=A0A443I161_BYSSP|nr:hypothetical protein C8Q69DRAFT_150036 [Paecilomyces variotii]KAJ9247894.1 hypothetical protein DTO207G8_7787 [Paecilomyces variotii]KAJ9365342.1 hypothetical protein DTO280E4_997 [Paecilomyces variotii]RWQ97805.1 hypothetical protein C8Q69DRAFT_150036 [Paecilomyces variotii]
MSADLLAEFGSGSGSEPTQNASRQSQQRFQNVSLIPDLDFSGDVPAQPSSSDSKTVNFGSFQGAGHTSAKSPISSPPLAESIWRHDDSGADVLFDATIEDAPPDDDDEWGEFEAPETTPDDQEDVFAPNVSSAPKVTPAPNLAFAQTAAAPRAPIGTNSTSKTVSGSSSGVTHLMDLLSVEDNAPPVETRQPSASINGKISTEDRSSPRGNTLSTLQAPIAKDEQDSFDEWGDFVDADDWKPTTQEPLPDTQVKKQNSSKRTVNDTPAPSLPAAASSRSARTPQTSQVSQSQVRPTNIPPPSVLLQLFPPLFERLQEDTTEAKKDPNKGAMSLYLVLNLACTLKVASRIIAGRTLRWKRDIVLSQSTKIGPARSGKQGGMKLSSVSKSENVKEEQEAVEVLDAWRRRAALFNSLIISAGERPIPVIAVHAPVDTVKGALKAPHACALCGLKRDERLPKIDDNAQDSFGEWWAEYWGHTDCKQFWEEHSKSLNQR